MSNFSPTNPIQPLSVGNVVSASVRLYRSNAKRYLILVLRSYLWSFVPIYGWAKSVEIAARISRLAYQELINQPETLTEAYQKTDRQVWNFLGASLLIGLANFGIVLGLLIAYSIFTFLTVLILGAFVGSSAPTAVSTVASVIVALLILAFVLIAFFIWLRVFSRLFIYEVPLAIEENADAASTIGRSWTLTQGSVGRIQLIIVVAGLLTWMLITSPMIILFSVLAVGITPNSSEEASTASVLLFYLLLFLGSGLVLPFWQAIKAVIYYDVRSRREGLGLELRDR